METARILVPFKNKLKNTVRFIASDLEEEGVFGGAAYEKYLAGLSAQQNFKILIAVDNEQSGWSEGGDRSTFWVTKCNTGAYDVPTNLAATAQKYGTLKVATWECYDGSDHQPFVQAGIPAFFTVEYNPLSNPYFDSFGDSYSIIDQDYFFKISQIVVTFSTQLVGVSP
jgi:Zn-dependent M28 family amino/carboxypeptidase